MLIEKLKAWLELTLPADTIGATNRFEFLRSAARLLDREMADRIITQPEQAEVKHAGSSAQNNLRTKVL